MRKHLIKKLILSIFTVLPLLALANDVTINFFNTIQSGNTFPIKKIIRLVKKNIDLSKSSGYYRINVQVIYDNQHNPDYLLVYLLSNKDYSFTVTKIKIDNSYRVISVTPNYDLLKKDFEQQPRISKQKSACPDNSVKFVSATPVDDIPTAEDAVESIYKTASIYGYHAIKLLGNDASVENYARWLTCPNLKGFFNVGHGNKKAIILSDGILPYLYFKNNLEGKLAEKTTVLFNSCRVDNNPLKNSLVKWADAQKYGGGISSLAIGPSELVSKCFWNLAFQKQPMEYTLKTCNEQYDPEDIFGMQGYGADIMSPP